MTRVALFLPCSPFLLQNFLVFFFLVHFRLPRLYKIKPPLAFITYPIYYQQTVTYTEHNLKYLCYLSFQWKKGRFVRLSCNNIHTYICIRLTLDICNSGSVLTFIEIRKEKNEKESTLSIYKIWKSTYIVL